MPSSPFKEEYVAHTLRLPKALNDQMLFRVNKKYSGNIQAYLSSLVSRDVELPNLPDCKTCGFRNIAENILEYLRKG